jgi:uncharacterized protein (TIGR02285 family)
MIQTLSLLGSIYDAPPNFILTGPQKGQGFIQQLLLMVIDHMPHYEHRVEVSSQNRALDKLRAGENVCHPALMVNPNRKGFIHYTLPSLVSPTSRLVMRNELDTPDTIKLGHLLFETKNIIALVKGRSFGNPIDDLINHKDARRNVVRLADENTDTIFKLIQAKRVDATIAYPAELNYFRIKNQDPLSPLKIVGIEGLTEYIMASMGCAKTEWGKSVVADLNQIIGNLRQSDEYQIKMNSWWKQQGASESFNTFYKEEFLKSN